MPPLIPPTSYVTGDNMYENMLDLLVEAKLNPRNLARGESMRFFNQAYDAGAMKDFVEPDYPLNASSRQVESSVFDQTRNDPAIQNLGADDILFTYALDAPPWHPIGYASYYPNAGQALHQVELPQNPFLRAMAAASSNYNIPAVDMNMQTLLQDFGEGNPQPTYDVSASVAKLPESIRPDVLNFYSGYNDGASAYVATGWGAGDFAFDSDQAMYFNQEEMMRPPFNNNWWTSVPRHEAGHILDRGLAGVQLGRGATDDVPYVFTEDRKQDYISEQDKYREIIEQDQAMGSIRERFNIEPDMPLYFNAGGRELNLDDDFVSDYSLNNSDENVEDFAERFMLYLNDAEDGWAMEDITGTKRWRFVEMYPRMARYFDTLLIRNAVMDALIPSRA